MLRIVNALSITTLIAAASHTDDHAKRAKYLQFAGKYNKHITTRADMEVKEHNFELSESKVNKCNEKAAASGDADAIRCGHNKFSDWTNEEFKEFVHGLRVDEAEVEAAASATPSGRHL